MSLKPLQTHLTAVSSLYAPYTTTGGGGGGGGSGSTITVSSLTVSSITGEGGAPIYMPTQLLVSSVSASAVNTSSLGVSSVGAAGAPVWMPTQLQVSSIGGGLGPNGLTIFDNGIEMPANGVLRFALTGDIQFADSTGVITGVSSINGAPYAAATPAVNIGGPFTLTIPSNSTATPVVSFSTTVGHAYTIGGSGTLQQSGAGVIADSDVVYMNLFDGGSVAYNLNGPPFSVVSTLANSGGVAFPVCGTWIASAANASIAHGNASAGTAPSSTATVSRLVLKDLGPV